jgi:hypothetical protein
MPIAVAIVSGCSQPSDEHVFTLYSNAASEPSWREHVATFDTFPQKNAQDKAWQDLFAKENQWKCDKAARLFKEDWDRSVRGQEQVKYWCEKGRFRK